MLISVFLYVAQSLTGCTGHFAVEMFVMMQYPYGNFNPKRASSTLATLCFSSLRRCLAVMFQSQSGYIDNIMSVNSVHPHAAQAISTGDRPIM
jgi:hypothetical protein